jgi:hypothetical protein
MEANIEMEITVKSKELVDMLSASVDDAFTAVSFTEVPPLPSDDEVYIFTKVSNAFNALDLHITIEEAVAERLNPLFMTLGVEETQMLKESIFNMMETEDFPLFQVKVDGFHLYQFSFKDSVLKPI